MRRLLPKIGVGYADYSVVKYLTEPYGTNTTTQTNFTGYSLAEVSKLLAVMGKNEFHQGALKLITSESSNFVAIATALKGTFGLSVNAMVNVMYSGEVCSTVHCAPQDVIRVLKEVYNATMDESIAAMTSSDFSEYKGVNTLIACIQLVYGNNVELIPASPSDAAKIIYLVDRRFVQLIVYMYNGGWYDLDSLVAGVVEAGDNPLLIIQDLWEAMHYLELYRLAGPKPVWDGPGIAIAMSHTKMSLKDLGQAFLMAGEKHFFTQEQIYYSIKTVSDLGISMLKSKADLLSDGTMRSIINELTTLDDGLPFIIMHENGMDSYAAANIMADLGWDSCLYPACAGRVLIR